MTATVTPLHVCGCCGENPGLPRRLRCQGQPDTVVLSCNTCRREIKRTIKRGRPVARVLHRIGLTQEQMSDVMLYLYDVMEKADDPRGEDQSAG